MTEPKDDYTDEQLDAIVADAARLQAVRNTGLLDSAPDDIFDRFSKQAAEITGAPVAFVSLVDKDRDFYKSHSGFGEPLASARQLKGRTFCHYALKRRAELAIEDTRAHPVFRKVPTVESLGVAAYLGMPLLTRNGQALGSLCVVDMKPRRWTPEQREALAKIAEEVMAEIERRQNEAAGATG